MPVERRRHEHDVGRHDLREHCIGVVARLMTDEVLHILLAAQAADATPDAEFAEPERLDIMAAEPGGEGLKHAGGVAFARTAVDEKDLHPCCLLLLPEGRALGSERSS